VSLSSSSSPNEAQATEESEYTTTLITTTSTTVATTLTAGVLRLHVMGERDRCVSSCVSFLHTCIYSPPTQNYFSKLCSNKTTQTFTCFSLPLFSPVAFLKCAKLLIYYNDYCVEENTVMILFTATAQKYFILNLCTKPHIPKEKLNGPQPQRKHDISLLRSAVTVVVVIAAPFIQQPRQIKCPSKLPTALFTVSL